MKFAFTLLAFLIFTSEFSKAQNYFCDGLISKTKLIILEKKKEFQLIDSSKTLLAFRDDKGLKNEIYYFDANGSCNHFIFLMDNQDVTFLILKDLSTVKDFTYNRETREWRTSTLKITTYMQEGRAVFSFLPLN